MEVFILAAQKSFFEKVTWIFENNWPLFWYGIKITILLAVVGTVAGLIIGLLMGTARTFEVNDNDKAITKIFKKIMHAFVSIYVWFFRGTPMMVQAMLIYYGLKGLLQWDALTAGLVIISINTGAYMTEIIRSGIQSVDNGQREGARSIGMNNAQTMMYVILPQAIKNSFPSIGNQLIVNIKDSSMLNVISVIDLYFQTTSSAGSTMQYTENFFIATIIYLLMTSVATIILSLIEKHMNKVPDTVEREI
ncbi:amino acid ABC transporter permease [Breznakia pachnodae]|uniref:Lysine transport system permease protein n=1 Tax=Breznakia pachnodae TaxID=265178 RepID=A0ABU0E657_9FIRM|nr:amino acid ABC transporter permease [Breznakia pachnodae]MDQ0362183.1 putative lysine transport system permease protein [Breznakia pachnodae]